MLPQRDHTLRLPYVPAVIAETDLVDGVFLYSKADRRKLLAYLKKNYADKDIRVSKEELNDKRLPSRYSVIVFDHQYYLMYLGRQHNRHAGAGAFGVVKHLQNLETGEFDHVIKIFSEWHQPPGEPLTQRVDVGQLSTDLHDEYACLHALGEASASMPIWRHSHSKGMQLLQPQKAKKGINLNDFIKNYRLLHGGKIKDSQYLLTILINMCVAVNDLHDAKKLLHRDIKLQNFMVNPQTAEVELIDFGFAIPIDTVFDNNVKRMGTLSYVAPEIMLNPIPGYSKKSDAFALGVAMAVAFNIADENTGGILNGPVKKFIPRSLRSKNYAIMNNPLMIAVYNICLELLKVDPVDRMDITTAIRRLRRLLNACREPVKLFVFNLADYIGFSNDVEIIYFLSQLQVREVVIAINQEDKNNPAMTSAAIGFTRLAQDLGYIVHADALIIPANVSNANILQQTADHLAQTSPSIQYECSYERFVLRRHQQYLDAVSVVIENIPHQSIKKQYADKFAEYRGSGASVAKIVAGLKLLADAGIKSELPANIWSIFNKKDMLTRQIIKAISVLDLNVEFSESALAGLLHRFAASARNVRNY